MDHIQSLYWICYNIVSGINLFILQDMWDLSFLTRDQTHIPRIRRQSLNY